MVDYHRKVQPCLAFSLSALHASQKQLFIVFACLPPTARQSNGRRCGRTKALPYEMKSGLFYASLREGGGTSVASDGRSPRKLHQTKSEVYALSSSRLRRQLSLRFGHARGLTAHRAVIQGPRAASLPPGGGLFPLKEKPCVNKNSKTKKKYAAATVNSYI